MVICRSIFFRKESISVPPSDALHFRRDLLEWSHNESEEEKEYLQCSKSGVMRAGRCGEGVSELLPEQSRAAINEGGLQGQ